MELWSYGVMEIWSYGVMELWRYGVVVKEGGGYLLYNAWYTHGIGSVLCFMRSSALDRQLWSSSTIP